MISCDLEGVSIFCILFFLSSFYLSYSYHPSTANTRSRFSMSWAVMDGGRERARGEKRRNKEKKRLTAHTERNKETEERKVKKEEACDRLACLCSFRFVLWAVGRQWSSKYILGWSQTVLKLEEI